jgi:hypothetical protein
MLPSKPATEAHDSLVRTDSAEISCSDGTLVDGSCSDVSLSSSVSSPGSWSVASPFNSFSVYDSP